MDEEKNEGNSFDKPERPMFDGDWECSECKKPITQLPFQPKEGQEVSCKECYISKRNANRSDRPMVQGNWKCSGCEKEITELPFQPSGDRPLFCRDCFRSNRT